MHKGYTLPAVENDNQHPNLLFTPAVIVDPSDNHDAMAAASQGTFRSDDASRVACAPLVCLLR